MARKPKAEKADKQTLQRQMHANRSAQGWEVVQVLVPPALAEVMEQRRGDLPRSQWLALAAARSVGLALTPDQLERKRGRPATSTRPKPIAYTPFDPSPPVVLPGIGWRMREQGVLADGVMAVGDLGSNRTGLLWRKSGKFGSYDPYFDARNFGIWSRTHWSVPARAAERIIERARASAGGAVIVPLHVRDWSGITIHMHPMRSRTDRPPAAWAPRIDLEEIEHACAGDRRRLADFLVANAGPLGGLSWFQNAGGAQLFAAAISANEFQEIREKLEARGVRVGEGEPVGLSKEPVTAQYDDMGLSVRIVRDRGDRRHLRLSPAANHTDRFPVEITLPAPLWRDQAIALAEMGVAITETDRPGSRIPEVNWSAIPGWTTPAANGYLLREYQRDAIRFFLERRMRAVCGDEMGLGKTGEAIAAATAAGYRKNLVVCPKNAVGVWRRQITEWAAPGTNPEVVVIHSSTDVPALPAGDDQVGWILVTYDTITPRKEVIAIPEQWGDQVSTMLQEFGASHLIDEETRKITLDPADPESLQPLIAVRERLHHLPAELSRIPAALDRVMGPVSQAISAWNPHLTIVDEAHRIKNRAARRTGVVRELTSEPTRGALLLTGTPLRNKAEEALVLAEAIVPVAELRRDFHSIGSSAVDAAKALLGAVMIRRTKDQVLTELPPNIRTRVDLDLESIAGYAEAMAAAQEAFEKALQAGQTLAQARMAAQGNWSQARKALGVAKAASGQITDLVEEVVAEKGCCLLWAHHRDVVDELARQLRDIGLRVATVDGRTRQMDRDEAERAFQAGEIDVFLGGITAAGEALTLTRADTSIFAEASVVPAEMLQAEDRGHRLGQTAAGYNVMTCLALAGAPIEVDEITWRIVQRKVGEINAVLGEQRTLDPEAQAMIDGADSASDVLAALALATYRQKGGETSAAKNAGKSKNGSTT
ncbi:SNF2-related protein [Azospirillum rugosum]|uniref:Superfamily II DNA or RNA helicase n=1 Tax=Azospirillum rugosum TaxID=416170 RepID=A0ABS4SRB1_9PROT|nr:SNF2-related protein [Azospirillum rugosum]MBP2295101.1 superfamily II DNA or RNA helicase [Azospirillum rugosum]MDQ0528475.1 superfamily II DNA or RNA helicase [Azospirillum rugosum]